MSPSSDDAKDVGNSRAETSELCVCRSTSNSTALGRGWLSSKFRLICISFNAGKADLDWVALVILVRVQAAEAAIQPKRAMLIHVLRMSSLNPSEANDDLLRTNSATRKSHRYQSIRQRQLRYILRPVRASDPISSYLPFQLDTRLPS